MRASLILLALSALAAAQLSSESVNQETTVTETSIESSTETPTDTVIETTIESTATDTTTGLETTATETSTLTTSQPLIPTGSTPEQSTPVIGSSSFTTSPSPTSSTSTRSSSTTTKDSTSTSTATETATSTSDSQDAEGTSSDNGAFALPTANPLLGVSKLRRLAADHAALHEGLPPNYLFPPEDTQSDDITQLTTLLAGPQGTPYSQGLWRLHLKLPEDYPKSPPKAIFKTRIWHPNVEESTGAVCVDTLKRDWKSTLTLKDVLVTISCLLIYPNPDSALNATAGALLQENYDAFARQAKLMTSIHAPVPAEMRAEVMEAKMRGEDSGTTVPEQQEEMTRSLRSRKGTRVQTVTMKKKPTPKDTGKSQPWDSENTRPHQGQLDQHYEFLSDDENENIACASKENDPSLSPSPVKLAPPLSPRKNPHGKRPLSVLTTSTVDIDPFVSTESEDMQLDASDNMMTPSERNIAANSTPTCDIQDRDSSPQRKSPKISLLNRGPNFRLLPEEPSGIDFDLKIYEDAPEALNQNPLRPPPITDSSSSSQNSLMELDLDPAIPQSHQHAGHAHPLATLPPSSSACSNPTMLKKPVSVTRKVSGQGLKKAKPRIGIRRL
ncbi:hypothetical protein BDW75DRAFT_236168 [Aspergillus navahoensis]